MKLTLAVVLAAIVAVQSFPVRENDIASAAAAGQWDEVHRILSNNLRDRYKFTALSAGDVRSLKPQPGGHVYGESEYTFHSSSNVNGQKKEESGGHKVVNNDGQVVEYDIKP